MGGGSGPLYAQGLKGLRHWNFCACQVRAKIKTKYFSRTQNALESHYLVKLFTDVQTKYEELTSKNWAAIQFHPFHP